MLKKVFEITPVAKPRMSQKDVWAKRPCVLKYRAYCDELRLQAGKWELPYSFAVTFVCPMPKSWSKKKRAEMEGKPMQTTPDNSNLLKALEDALLKMIRKSGRLQQRKSGELKVEWR
jgi:Holliday junction resolvase RusA-like endonuclease